MSDAPERIFIDTDYCIAGNKSYSVLGFWCNEESKVLNTEYIRKDIADKQKQEVPKPYCDRCSHLRPKEHEQSSHKEHHLCGLYGMPIMHMGEHPRLPTPDRCVRYEHYKLRKK